MANSYLDIIEAVRNYYGSGSDQWVDIARHGFNAANAESILSQVPGVNLIKNADGSIRSWTYSAYESTIGSDSTIPELINSNTQTGTGNYANSANVSIPANMGVNQETENVTMTSGMNSPGNFVMGTVAPAVAATGLGITLGKTISQAAYNAGFNWLSWAGVDMESLNPETWDSITVDSDSISSRLFNMVFGINQDGTTQAYIDENAAAYLALYMQQVGMFSTGGETVTEESKGIFSDVDDYIPFAVNNGGVFVDIRGTTYNISGKCVVARYTKGNQITIMWVSDTPNIVIGQYGNEVIVSDPSGFTYDGKTVYGYIRTPGYPPNWDLTTLAYVDVGSSAPPYYVMNHLMWLALYSSEAAELIPGTGDQSGAVLPDLSSATTPTDVLNLLKSQYPDLFDNSITQNVVQPDGTISEYHYIPINLPEATNSLDQYPVTGDGVQSQPYVDPNTATDALLNLTTSLIGTPANPMDTPDTGTGVTPSVVIPPGSANALYSIYNPSQAELNSFGAWLWSSNFVDQLLKLFNDPMQAIIGLHKVFAPPEISGTGTIKVGYLDSGVSSNLVSNQYVTVDCGTVALNEYFGNVFDYDPFTQVYIYLPFVGIEKLDTGDVMRGVIGVKYHVDVLTGACLAEVTVNRDGAGGILYTFAGNCAVQYPISAGSYMGIVASLTSIAGGVVGTIASGGALAPVAMGAINGIMNAHTRVNHSGAFSGNAGAMGVKTPYLIITRPQTCLADNFPAFDGYPANKTTTLSACSGFVKCESCHVENIHAIDSELSEIEMLLKGGIII